jgi:hypothetical protein
MATDFEGLIPQGQASELLAAVELESVAMRLGNVQRMPTGVQSVPVVAVEPDAEWVDPTLRRAEEGDHDRVDGAQAGSGGARLCVGRSGCVAGRHDVRRLGRNPLAALVGVREADRRDAAVRDRAGARVVPGRRCRCRGGRVALAAYWDATKGAAIVGGWNMLVIGVREDIRFETSDSAVLTDAAGARAGFRRVVYTSPITSVYFEPIRSGKALTRALRTSSTNVSGKTSLSTA